MANHAVKISGVASIAIMLSFSAAFAQEKVTFPVAASTKTTG